MSGLFLLLKIFVIALFYKIFNTAYLFGALSRYPLLLLAPS